MVLGASRDGSVQYSVRVVGSSSTAARLLGPPTSAAGVSATVYCKGLAHDMAVNEIYGGYGRKMILIYRPAPKIQIIN